MKYTYGIEVSPCPCCLSESLEFEEATYSAMGHEESDGYCVVCSECGFRGDSGGYSRYSVVAKRRALLKWNEKCANIRIKRASRE